jgi:hypothetical protein
MSLRTGLGLALASVLALGACGDDDAAGLQSISAVVPGDVFAGASAGVLISGDNTEWEDGVTVDFGAGVQVGDVTVASPTALWVEITVDPDAGLGARDVTLTQGEGEDDTLSYVGAFNVVSPLKISADTKNVDQGSITVVTVQSIDFLRPFDTTDGNIEIVVPETSGLMAFPEGEIEPYILKMSVYANVDADAGPVDLEILSGPPDGDPISLVLPDAIEIEAKTYAASTLDELSGTFSGPNGAQTFKVEGDGAMILEMYASFDPEVEGSTQFFILGEGGSWSNDLIAVGSPGFFDPGGYAQFLVTGTYYVVVRDIAGIGAYDFECLYLITSEIGDETAAEDDDNDVAEDAQAVGHPIVVNASLADDTDVDFYAITIAAPTLGGEVEYTENLLIYTSSPNSTDTTITVYEEDGETEVVPEQDNGYGEGVSTGALPAGTYLIRIQNTAPPYPPIPGDYDLAIGLLPPEEKT